MGALAFLPVGGGLAAIALDVLVVHILSTSIAKVTTQRQASSAFRAAAGRQNWSQKLREDHRLLAAVEKLMKQAGGGGHVPVTRAAKALPALAVIAGAGTNSHVLGDVANQSIRYAQTVFLSEKHGYHCPRSCGTTMSTTMRTPELRRDLGRRRGAAGRWHDTYPDKG